MFSPVWAKGKMILHLRRGSLGFGSRTLRGGSRAAAAELEGLRLEAGTLGGGRAVSHPGKIRARGMGRGGGEEVTWKGSGKWS